MLAIIGGSGLTQLSNMEISRREVVRTPYGEPSGALTFGNIGGHEVVFLARHGYGHTIPPHQVNYCANIWALHAQGAKDVVSIASVGGITSEFKPGALAVPDQIIDYTHGRAGTFVRSEVLDEPSVHAGPADLARTAATEYVHTVRQLGLNAQEAARLVQNTWNES